MRVCNCAFRLFAQDVIREGNILREIAFCDDDDFFVVAVFSDGCKAFLDNERGFLFSL